MRHHGYIGSKPAVPLLDVALLEYRGYDSAGVRWRTQAEVRKRVGRIANPLSWSGIAARGLDRHFHTRWATHGGVSDDNAHPHTDQSGHLVICHNGRTVRPCAKG
jgi:glucosamine--fructose-6-phosphate aminotransferase (isomerizing)